MTKIMLAGLAMTETLLGGVCATDAGLRHYDLLCLLLFWRFRHCEAVVKLTINCLLPAEAIYGFAFVVLFDSLFGGRYLGTTGAYDVTAAPA